MTCKNCIYEPMCHNVIAYGMDTDDVTGTFITDIEKHCKHFKDKSRFIVLPCKIGDKMYCDGKYFAEHCRGKVMEFIVNSIETSASNIFRGEIDVKFDFEDFGKTVFLTREEAEKALAEREGAPDAGNS